MKIEVEMEAFIKFGGSNQFAKNISEALFIDSSRVKVTSIRKGSIIIDYEIIESPDDNLEQLGNYLGQIIEFGLVEVGGPISSYGKPGETGKQPEKYVPIDKAQAEIAFTEVVQAKESGKGAAIALSIVLPIIFIAVIGGLAFSFLKKRKDNQQLFQVEKTVEPPAEQAFDANDLIRNRKENEVDDGKELDDTKTVSNETLRSRQMTPKKTMEIKDAEDVKSMGMISHQIDKAIAENMSAANSMAPPLNPQDAVNPMMMQMMQMMTVMQQNQLQQNMLATQQNSRTNSSAHGNSGIQMLGMLGQSIDSTTPAMLATQDVNQSLDLPNTNPYKKARQEGLMGINEGDGMQIKVSSEPIFGADIIADGSDGVQIKAKKKKKKKLKTLMSQELTKMVADQTSSLLQSKIVEASRQEEEDGFTMIGGGKPKQPTSPEEMEVPMISPFGKKKKGKKKKKVPEFEELELEIEAFNID